MRKKIICLLLVIFILTFTKSVNAEWYVNNVFRTTLNTNNNILDTDSEIIISIDVNVSYPLKGISAKLEYENTKLDLIKCESKYFTCSIKDNIVLDSIDGIEGNKQVAKITFKKLNSFVKGETTEIKLLNIEGDNNVVSWDVKKQIHVLQDSVDLIELTVNNNLVSGFDKNTTIYTIETEEEKINIGASSLSIISGIGEKKLEYGNNIFKIKVKSETNEEKVYVINAYRKEKIQTQDSNNENTENTKNTTTNNKDTKKSNKINKATNKKLSSNKKIKYLKIEGTDFVFNEDVFEYETKLISDTNRVKLDYKLEDNKSKLVVSGDMTLLRKENHITISVIAEDGSQQDYKVKIINENFDKIENVDEQMITDGEDKQKEILNHKLYSIVLSGVSVILIVAIGILIKKRKM